MLTNRELLEQLLNLPEKLLDDNVIISVRGTMYSALRVNFTTEDDGLEAGILFIEGEKKL